MGPPVTPRNERPRSALFHRPGSARPSSPPLSPPLVTIVSPKSPPKSAHLSHHSSIPQLPSPNPSSANGLGARPAPPVPPHFTRPAEKLDVQIPIAAEPRDHRSHVKSPIPVRKTNAASDIDTALANAPPPINRADKPRLPYKPPDIKNVSALEPNTKITDEKVSPFSTPPSSDESPTQIFQKRGTRISPSVPIITPKEKGNPPFSPPLAQGRSSEEHKAVASRIFPDPRLTHGHSQSVMPLGGAETARPGLPPRRMTEKGSQPQTSRSNEARIASTSRVVRQVSQPVPIKSITPSPISRVAPQPLDFLPPPKRVGTGDVVDSSKAIRFDRSLTTEPAARASDALVPIAQDQAGVNCSTSNTVEYPDVSQMNRRPPSAKHGIQEIDTNYDTRLFDFCGDYLCTTGYLTRAWDLSTGSVIMNLGHGEQTKVTALAFKPGATAEEEGLRLWMGTNFGDLYEVDIPTQSVISTKSSAHNRREIIKVYRSQNSMWTLDDGGSLHVWSSNRSGLPSVQDSPIAHRLPKGHTFSIVVHSRLWLATGKDIRIFNPGSSSDADFQHTLYPLTQPSVGEVTSGTVISSQDDRVYFGHSDGKITIYSIADFSCLGVFNVSVYKINALVGAGDYLWAGYNTGMIYVYDTRTRPWRTKKDWRAHGNPVSSILVDRSSVWKSGVLQVASIGTDNAVRLWDGLLEEDWLGNHPYL